ncbi:MAG TPA: Hpt domain-containing protein [Patescibacteria group bacterium]|nr:Hpt domain-containing protein [Patescibacteria group bacterium]
MNNDLTQFSDLYIQTAQDYIALMKKNIDLFLENSTKTSAVEQLFIASHSLKSQSAVMGYTTTSEASKLLEHLFRAVKENQLTLTKEMIAQAVLLIKKLEESIKMIAQTKKELDLTTDIKESRTMFPKTDASL